MSPSEGRAPRQGRAEQVDWGESRPRPRRSEPPRTGTTDWGVGRGSAEPEPTPGERARSPWPQAVRRQRLLGIAFALIGLALATWAAMNLATNAEAGRLWIPPWLVAVLAGAGLVSAAGYLAWAGGTAVRDEGERWRPRAVDAAAGLTDGTVSVPDAPALEAPAPASGPLLEEGRPSDSGRGARWDAAGGSSSSTGRSARVESGPAPIMGSSTLDQSSQAPAGVAGAVGGFLLSAAVVCAVLALVLGPAWLLGTVTLAACGAVSVRLAGDWLGGY